LLRHTAKELSDRKTGNFRATTSRTTPRTITNRDLEAFRRERVESEMLYERSRKELGLPSIEETRRRAAVEADESFQTIQEIHSRQQESETYWRTRASALRSELAASNARINFLQRRLNEMPQPFSTGAFIGALPFGTFARARVGNALRPPGVPNPGVFAGLPFGPQLRARVNFGNGMNRGQCWLTLNLFAGRDDLVGSHSFPFRERQWWACLFRLTIILLKVLRSLPNSMSCLLIAPDLKLVGVIWRMRPDAPAYHRDG
jgi:hypothetical protein